MTSIQIDIKDGLSSSVAIKGPCRVATTANITLSGEQTIDGVAAVTDDRVLVKDQTTGADNGIYIVDTGAWRRAKDFNKSKDIKTGTMVNVVSGSAGSGWWEVTTTGDIAVGTTSIAFAQRLQPYDADLASWAAITRASGFDAFAATPSSANLRALLTDETGTGAAVFGTSPTITTPTIAGTNGAQAPLSAALDDSSSVAGNGAKFWNPLYFGNAGTAIVHRLNRVLVGEAVTNTSDIGPITTKDWLETLLTNTTAVAQLASVSATGQLGVMGAARSSDYRTIFSSATGGAQGLTGLGYNNDTTPATTPIAVGINGIAVHAASVNGVTLNQMDINSAGTTVSTTPFNGVTSGSTWALGLTAGAYSTLATQNATGAMYIGAGTTTKFNKGIISMNGALDTAVGAGGGGVTYEAYRGQSFRWLNSGNTVDAELWGNASGLITSKSFVPSANDGAALGTATASFSDVFLASGAVVNFNNGDVTITHAANALAFGGAANGYSFDAAALPSANDSAALGSATVSWSDLFLADGGVINWNNGTVTLTESATGLALNAQIAATRAGTPALFKNTTDAASNTALRVESGRATRANNDSVNIDTYVANSAGTATATARFSSVLTNVTAGAETAALTLNLTNAGAALVGAYNWTSANYYPVTNDGAALGLAGTAWADLFLASGAVINFANGNYTVTHSSGTLTFSGAVLSSGTGGVGYATGAGGTVTQATSRTTGVTLNKTSGAITMFTAAGSATPASFTVTNSTVAATDTIVLNIKSGASNTYFYFVTTVAAGSFVITFWTTGGTASDTPVINYNVIKGVAA